MAQTQLYQPEIQVKVLAKARSACFSSVRAEMQKDNNKKKNTTAAAEPETRRIKMRSGDLRAIRWGRVGSTPSRL